MTRSKGFTLVELSVAFIIIVLLLAGAMIPLTTQIELRGVADTQRSIDQIREAIIGFAQANGRLPCPAAGNLAAGTANAGTEALSGGAPNRTCTAAFGVVPWATLGVPETDSWGRRFSYAVSPVFADESGTGTWATSTGSAPTSPGDQNQPCPTVPPSPAPSAPTSFALCTLGDIAVFTRAGLTTTAVPLAVALPAVIISHGKNGFGAWQTNGTQLNPIPAGTDEARNLSGTPNATPPGGYPSRAFYSHAQTPGAAGCVDPPFGSANAAPACAFDDIVVVITSNALIARMVAAGRLP